MLSDKRLIKIDFESLYNSELFLINGLIILPHEQNASIDRVPNKETSFVISDILLLQHYY